MPSTKPPSPTPMVRAGPNTKDASRSMAAMPQPIPRWRAAMPVRNVPARPGGCFPSSRSTATWWTATVVPASHSSHTRWRSRASSSLRGTRTGTGAGSLMTARRSCRRMIPPNRATGSGLPRRFRLASKQVRSPSLVVPLGRLLTVRSGELTARTRRRRTERVGRLRLCITVDAASTRDCARWPAAARLSRSGPGRTLRPHIRGCDPHVSKRAGH